MLVSYIEMDLLFVTGLQDPRQIVVGTEADEKALFPRPRTRLPIVNPQAIRLLCPANADKCNSRTDVPHHSILSLIFFEST